VILAFVAYSIQQRNEGNQAMNRVVSSASPTASTDNLDSPSPANTATPTTYKNGTYTGKSADAFYGFIQVKATISGGKLTNIEFLDYPQDQPNSVTINQQAMPVLKSQAIQVQSAQVDGVSGATDTNHAFTESLGDALAQAHV